MFNRSKKKLTNTFYATVNSEARLCLAFSKGAPYSQQRAKKRVILGDKNTSADCGRIEWLMMLQGAFEIDAVKRIFGLFASTQRLVYCLFLTRV